jgi:hypothetical protein
MLQGRFFRQLTQQHYHGAPHNGFRRARPKLAPFLPVGDRQLSKVQRLVSRLAPELAASECRVVVISARCPAGDDPLLPSCRVAGSACSHS